MICSSVCRGLTPDDVEADQGIYRVIPSSADSCSIQRHLVPHHRLLRHSETKTAYLMLFSGILIGWMFSAPGVELPILFRQELDKAYGCVRCRSLHPAFIPLVRRMRRRSGLVARSLFECLHMALTLVASRLADRNQRNTELRQLCSSVGNSPFDGIIYRN